MFGGGDTMAVGSGHRIKDKAPSAQPKQMEQYALQPTKKNNRKHTNNRERFHFTINLTGKMSASVFEWSKGLDLRPNA